VRIEALDGFGFQALELFTPGLVQLAHAAVHVCVAAAAAAEKKKAATEATRPLRRVIAPAGPGVN
jgi:hypothetical protein